MTLTTHAIVGAGIVSMTAYNPVLGLSMAFASHFILDAIPHLSYKIRSASIHPHGEVSHITFDKNFFKDIFSIGTDGLAGIIFSILLFATSNTFWLIVAGACVGMLPDMLQFVYSKWKHEPLISLQHFHEWIHTKYRFENHPLLGIISQVVLVVVFVVVVKVLG